MDFVDLIRLDGAVQVSGGVAGGPHAAFADDAAERTLGRIVYRRGETSEVMASIDLEFSSKHYDAPWDFWGWGSDITFFGLHQGWAVSLLGWLDTVAIIVSAGIIRVGAWCTACGASRHRAVRRRKRR